MKLGKLFILEVAFIIAVLVLAVVFVGNDSRLSANQGIGLPTIGAAEDTRQLMFNKTLSIDKGKVLTEQLTFDGRDVSVVSFFVVVREVDTEGVLMIVLNTYTAAKLLITKNSISSCIDNDVASRNRLTCVVDTSNSLSNETNELSMHIVVASTCGFDIINRQFSNVVAFVSTYEGDISFSVVW
jgi:hypothetical protein